MMSDKIFRYDFKKITLTSSDSELEYEIVIKSVNKDFIGISVYENQEVENSIYFPRKFVESLVKALNDI